MPIPQIVLFFLFFFSKTSLSMASKPLDILKKGLAKLKISFKAKKEHLEAKLSRQESISLDAVK